MPKPPDGADWPFAPPYVFMAPGYRVEAMLDGSKLSHGDTLCVMSGRFLQADTTGTTGGLISQTTPPTPDDILKKILVAWDEIAAAESAKNPFFKKVYDNQRQYASRVVPARRAVQPNYDIGANYYWPEKK